MRSRNAANIAWAGVGLGLGLNIAVVANSAVRKERAVIESFRISPLKDGLEGPFCNYSVTGASEPYQVEFRSATENTNTCTCPDFRKNGLGTCKHIEKLRRKFSRLKGQSPRIEIFMDRETSMPRMICPDSDDAKARTFCLKFIDEAGFCRPPANAAVSLLIQDYGRLPSAVASQIRISGGVREFDARNVQNTALAEKRSVYAAQIRENQGRLQFLNHALYDYQVEGMLHLAFKGRAILADDMGLGKTVQAIAAATLREAADIRRVLVVAPTSLKTEWEEQIRKFSNLKYEVLLGSRQQRLEVYKNTSAFFLITNYEQVVRDHDLISAHFAPGLMILAEAQRSLKMAKLLSDGGFTGEAAGPAVKAVLGAATALHALTLETQPESAPDITTVPGAIDRLSGSLAGPDALLLQLCLAGVPEGTGNLVKQASAFVDQVATRLSAEAHKP